MADVILPEGWPRPSGYSDAVSSVIGAGGRIVAVSGQVGWDPVTRRFETDDFEGQVRQALLNVRAVLEAAGCTILDVVRMTWYVTDRDEYLTARGALGEAWREVFGRHYPAMSVVVVGGLIEPAARVEIEATAVAPEA